MGCSRSRPAGLFALGLAAALALWSGSSVAAPPISKIEARRLAPDIVKRRVLDQLADILQSQQHPRARKAPVRALSDMWLWTRPHAANKAGLCTVDVVVVKFQPVSEDTGADTPVRAVGLSAAPRYKFLAPPADASFDEVKPADRARTDADCRKLTFRDVDFFAAEDEDLALTGVWSVRKAVEQARSGSPTFALTCRDDKPVSAEQCRTLLAGVRAEDVSDIRTCDGDANDRLAAYCTSLEIGDLDIRIFGSGQSPPDVSRVVVSREIVMFETLTD